MLAWCETCDKEFHRVTLQVCGKVLRRMSCSTIPAQYVIIVITRVADMVSLSISDALSDLGGQ